MDRAPDVSGHGIQDRYRDVGRRGTAMQPGNARAQCQARASREPLREFADTLSFDSRGARNVLGSIGGYDVAVGPRAHSPARHDIRHRERHQSLAPGLDR